MFSFIGPEPELTQIWIHCKLAWVTTHCGNNFLEILACYITIY